MIHPSHEPRSGRARKLALAVGVAGTAALAAAAGAPAAQAADYSCSASGLGLSSDLPSLTTALGAVTDGAGVPEGACGRSGAAPTLPDNPVLSGGLLTATTTLENAGGAQRDQVATSRAAIADLTVGKLSALGLPTLPTIPLPAIPTSLPIPLPTLPPITIPAVPPVLGLPGIPATTIAVPTSLPVSVNTLVTQLQSQLQDQLDNGSLLTVGAGQASATARCVDGRIAASGTSDTIPVKLLGVDVPLNGVAKSVVLDTSDLSLTTADVAGPVNAALGQLNPAVQAVLRPYIGQIQAAVIDQVLGALPAAGIPIDAIQATASTSPAVVDAGRVTQRGTTVTLKVAGQTVISGSLGTASVGFAGVDCAPAATPTTPTTPVVTPPPVNGSAPSRATAAQQLLQCSERRLVLTNVLQRPDRVALFGVADKAFAGQTVTIRFNADKKDVATAVVQPDGTFQTVAPLPNKAVRATNAARYQARIGSITSLDLKLQRRMTVSNLDQASGTVTIKGKLVEPLPVGGASVLLQRRVSCNELQNVKRVKADANGNFEITVPAPAGESAVVYRLQSKVRNNPRNKKTFRTYTLPQGIDIAK